MLITKNRGKIHGIDVSKSEANLAKAVIYVQCLDFTLPDFSEQLKGRDFDLVIGNCSLEHVLNIDLALSNISEVIEHIVEYPKFLSILFSVLKPEGKIWLSTPNYGFFLLPLLEKTVLEIIARASGFSRKGIHPSMFSSETLQIALQQAGFTEIFCTEPFPKLTLAIRAKKPQ